MNRVRVAAAALGWWALLAPRDPAAAQDAAALVRDAEPFVLPRLGTALSLPPGSPALPWQSDGGELSGTIGTAAAPDLDGLPCRRFRYTIKAASGAVAVDGTRCLAADNRWLPTAGADRAVLAAQSGGVRQALAANLKRLRYLGVDARPGDLSRALLAFEHDESLPPEALPTDGLLRATGRALARIPPPGAGCADAPPGDGGLACGQAR
jgi:hypothetical protein